MKIDLTKVGIASHLPPLLTITAKKALQKKNAYDAKQTKKRTENFMVEEGKEQELWNDLFEAIFSIEYATLKVNTLKRKGALHETDALIEFANITNRKFEKFISTLSEEKRKEYITERNEAEDFFFRYSASTQDEKKRTQKFLESLQNKR